MRKFTHKLLLFIIPIFIIATFNFLVDSAHLFNSKGYINKIVNILKENKNVINAYNCDERLLQKGIIDSGIKVDIVVMGSSRSDQIREYFFPKKKLMNLFVSGAVIQDYFALFNLLENNQSLPKTIIIGLDPWVLNSNVGENRWLSIADSYQQMLNKLQIDYFGNLSNVNLNNEKIKEIFKPKYFYNNIKYIFLKKMTLSSTTEKYLDTNVKLSDGSFVYDKKYREASNKEIEANAKSYISANNLYHISNYQCLGKNEKHALEKLIEYLKNRNIDIVFFLPPYHPIVYSFIDNNERYKMVSESENYFISLAEKYNIKLVGSFNPDKYQLKNGDFFDGMHPKEEIVFRIFTKELNLTKAVSN